MPVRFQLHRTKGFRMPAGGVSVARPSRFANPFRISAQLTRDMAMEGFENTVRGNWSPSVLRGVPDIEFAEAYRGHRRWVSHNGSDGWTVRTFLGKRDLGCYCALPEPGQADRCHAAILLRLANS